MDSFFGPGLASPSGNGEYVYYKRGAWSMIVPYVSGLYALSAQVYSDITPELFWKTALDTGDEIGEYRKIVNPIKLIEKFEKMGDDVKKENHVDFPFLHVTSCYLLGILIE